jgi:ribose transport system substrate-binding protein
MNCNVDACPPIGLGVKEGAEAVGWKYKQINYSSADPATLVAGMKQALQYHPAYVMVTGVPPEAGWSSVIPAYKAAGVKIIAGTLGAEKLDSTLIANVGSVTLATDAGKVLANWFIADSQGKGQAVLESVNDFPTIALVADSFASSVKANCPGCKVTRLNNTIAQAESGGVVPAIVSTLRSHPSASYIVTPAANLAEGLAAALSGAGLSNKVKWTGYAADPPALTALKSNKAAALIGTPLTYIGWQMMDTALRNTEGMTFVTDPKIPFQLLLPTSSFKVADSEDTPSDYASLFKKLWQVG